MQFDPQAGHKQTGHRPALVLSPASCNSRVGLMLCCPMTTQIKGYPFEVVVPGEIPGAVLADQIKSLDWTVRKARWKGTIALHLLGEVRAKAHALIGH